MKLLLKSLSVLALSLCGWSAHASLYVYEPFPASYTNGGVVSALPNGTSLPGTRLNDQTTVWNIGQGGGGGSPTNTYGAALSHGVLSYSNGSAGLYLSTVTTSGNRTRGILLTNAPITSGVTYASFLLNVQVPSTGDRLFAMLSSATSGSPSSGATAGIWVNANTNLMLSKGSSTAVGATTAASLTPGTHLIVMRYTITAGTGNDQMDLWIDPSGLGNGEEAVPASSLTNLTGTDLTGISSFYIYHPSSGYVPAGLFVDEIRVGTTWADVTPTAQCFTAGITTGPSNLTAVVGANAAFNVVATGTVPNYQWQLSTDNGTTFNNVSTGTGGTSASYTTAGLVAGDNGSKFRCIVTTPCDGLSATSSVATLTVVDPTGKWFRSAGSGTWGSSATWEMSNDGNSWVAANVAPTAIASNITIRAGHTVTVTAATSADDLTVASGGELDISGATLTLNDGAAAVDCAVNGILKVTSTANSAMVLGGSAGLNINNGATFQWSGNSAPVIPLATWADGSTCLIDNTLTTGNVNASGISGQNFYDFTINYPSVGFRTRLNISGTATTIRRDLNITIPDVASASVQLLTNTGTALTIGRNFTFNGGGNSGIGTKILTRSVNTETSTIKVAGNVTLNGYVDWFSTSGGGQTIMEFTGLNATAQLTLDNAHLIPGNTNNVSFIQDTGCNVTLLSPVPGCAAYTVGVNAVLASSGYLIRGAAAATFTLNSGSGLVATGTNQITAGFGTVNYAGTLAFGTSLPALNAGDTFLLFGGSTTYNGSFALIGSTPSHDWDTTLLNTTGELKVSGSSSGTPSVTSTVNGSFQILNITGGTASTGFSVLTNGDLTTPKASWPVAGGGTFDGGGAATYTNPIGSGASFQTIRVP